MNLFNIHQNILVLSILIIEKHSVIIFRRYFNLLKPLKDQRGPCIFAVLLVSQASNFPKGVEKRRT